MSKVNKDPDYAIKVEKAISDKYGVETIQHPAKNWNPQKEEIYLEQIKLLNQKLDKISKKLLNKDSNRSCPVCNIYSFDTKDDVYMSKHQCCRNCYIKYVEDREDRWASGWRPDKGENR